MTFAASAALVACGGPSSSTGDAGNTEPIIGQADARLNGVHHLSPERILKRAHRASRRAESVTVSGSFAAEDGTRNYRFYMTKRAVGGYMTSPTYGSVDLVALQGKVYLRAGAQLYRQLLRPQAAQAAMGKWLQISPRTARATGLLRWTDKDAYIESLLEPQLTARLKKVEVDDVKGVAAVGLTEPGTGTLSVATVGEPYPLQVRPAERSVDPVVLQDWNAAPVIQAPTPQETVVLRAPGQQ